jgi:hypothetical protein
VVNRHDFAGAIPKGVSVNAGDYVPLSISQELVFHYQWRPTPPGAVSVGCQAFWVFRMFRTVAGYHCPPLRVAIPRLFKQSQIP